MTKEDRRALAYIKRLKPEKADEVLGTRFPLDLVGTGAFRAAYRIRGTNLLIKFPLEYKTRAGEWTTRGNVTHARAEARKILKLREFAVMRPHLPPIYYFDPKYGVLVTRFYPGQENAASLGQKTSEALGRFTCKLVKNFLGVTLDDLFGDNLRSSKGNLVIVDLGY